MIASDGEIVKTAERGLIGLVLLRPEKFGELELEPRHFYDPRWSQAWEAMHALAEEGKPIDEITVAERIGRRHHAGSGDHLIAELGKCTLGSIPVLPESYVDIVKTAWVTRQILGAFSALTAANREGLEGEELLSAAMERLAAIQVEQPASAMTIGELARARLVEIVAHAEARAKGLGGTTGIATGISALDGLIGGLQRGIATVVAGRPRMGKSAFAMSVVDAVTRDHVGAHVFSLEDTRSAYVDRSLARGSNVAADLIRTCELGRDDLSRLGHAAQELHERPGWLVDDRSGITAEEIVRSVRRELKRNRTELVIVDYLQLLKAPTGFPSPSDKTRVADHAMNVLADAAKADNLAYLVLAQLNRDCEKRDNKRPQLSDLKQSGTIEERAKVVLMLYRPSVYREKDPQTGLEYPDERIEILVRKNNQGQEGRVVAGWHGPTTRID